MFVSCGLAASACGAAPDALDPAGETDTTDTLGSSICSGDNCPTPGDPKPTPPPAPQLDTYRLNVQGMEITGLCESGWEGNAAEVYWAIHASTPWTTIPMSSRSSDDPVSVGFNPVNGYPGYIQMNVSKDISMPMGNALTIHADAWDADDWTTGADDWLGNVGRTVTPNDLTRGVKREFGDFSNGGGEFCSFRFWYDITLL
jgi:hypothetical protein